MAQIDFDLIKAKGHINKAEIYFKFFEEYKKIGSIDKSEWCLKKMNKQLKKADKIHKSYI